MKSRQLLFATALAALLGGIYTARPDPPVIYKAMKTDQMTELRTRAWKLLPLFGKQTEGRLNPSHWTSVDTILPPPPIPGSANPAPVNRASKPALSPLAFADPREFKDLRSKTVTNPPSPPVIYESTFYNKLESDSVVAQRLKVPSVTAELLKDDKRDIVFPKGSVALKTFWYVVDDHTTVTYWDWNKIPRDDHLQPVTTFDSVCVRLNPAPGSGCLDAKKYFYTLTKDASMTFSKPQGAPDVQNGQTLILVALHIVSKQMPDWLWATYWWRGDGPLATHGQSWTCADAQRDAIKDDLAKMPAFWRYYSMDVAASFQIAKPPVDAADVKTCGTPGIIGINGEERIAVYSPFVEALLLNGRKSNCIACHALANTGMAADGPKVPPLGIVDQHLSLPTFELHVRTDYMWKVANHMPKSTFPSTPWPPKP
jgi:hypothetical protein